MADILENIALVRIDNKRGMSNLWLWYHQLFVLEGIYQGRS